MHTMGLASPELAEGASPNTAKGDNAMSKTKKNASKSSDPNLVPLNDAMKKPAKTKRTKKPKADKALSCLDAAAQVLKSAKDPMNCKAMINAMFTAKLWNTDAPTPAATLSSAILGEMKTKKSESRFKKVDRGQFVLKD